MQPDGSYQLRSPEGLDPSSPEALGTHRVLMDDALTVDRADEA